MKKVNFKKVLLALVAVFTLMVVGVEKAEAQAINEFSTGLYDPAPGAFFGSDEAKDVLFSSLKDMKDQLNNGTLSPGTPAYVAVEKNFIYWTGIYLELDGGKSVSQAIGQGLNHLNDSNGYGNLDRYELKDLRQGAIDLLQ